MILIDLIKVLTPDSEIIVYDTNNYNYLVTGKVGELISNSELLEEVISMRVTKVYYSQAYSGLMIDVE